MDPEEEDIRPVPTMGTDSSPPNIHSKAMFEGLLEFYRQSRFCDIQIFCENFSDPIRCHKLILSSFGSFFRTVLTDDSELIHLPDFQRSQVQEFLDSLYALFGDDSPTLDKCDANLVDFFGISLGGIESCQYGLDVKAEPRVVIDSDEEPLSGYANKKSTKRRKSKANESTSTKKSKRAKKSKSALQIIDKNGKAEELSAAVMNDLFPEEEFEPEDEDADWEPKKRTSTSKLKKEEESDENDEDYDEFDDEFDALDDAPDDYDDSENGGSDKKLGRCGNIPLTPAQEKEAKHLERNRGFLHKNRNKKLVDVEELKSCIRQSSGMININLTTPSIRANTRYSKVDELTTLKDSFQVLVGIKEEYGVIVGRPLAWTDPDGEEDYVRQFENARQAFRQAYGICDGDLLSSRVIMRVQDFGAKKRDQFNNMSDLQKVLMNKCTRDDLESMLQEHEIVEAFKSPLPSQTNIDLPYENWIMHISNEPITYQELVILGIYDHAVEVRKLEVMEDTPANIATFLMKALSLIWTGGMKSTKFPHSKHITDTHFQMARVAYKKRTAEKLLASNEPLPRPLPTFTCEICGKTITENAHFTKRSMHMRDHKAEMFQCDCGIEFKNPKEKRNHYFVVHAKWKVEQCPHCSMLGSAKAVAKHIATYHKGFMCDICGKVLPNSFRMFSHKKMVHETATCKDCGATFVGVSKLYYHIRTKHQERVLYRCDQCTVACSTQQALKTHWKRAHGSDQDRPFKCRECGKAFVEKPKLKYHLMNTHIRSRPFVCRYENCKSDFNDLCNLYAHEKKVHGKVRGQAPSINEFVTDEKMYEMGIIADFAAVPPQSQVVPKEEKFESMPEYHNM